MAKVTIQIEEEHIEEVFQAIKDRKESLEKVGANLLRRKLGDASKPVFDTVKFLTVFGDDLRTKFNQA